MGKVASKRRRVLRVQRKARPGRSVYYIAIPRDAIESMGLSAGDRFRFVRIGGALAYSPVEA